MLSRRSDPTFRDSMLRHMDDFFTSWPSPHLAAPSPGAGLALDVREGDDEFEVTADIPGVRKEDIDVSLEDGLLTISAERKQEKKREGDSWHFEERSWGSVRRSVRLPDTADPEQARASYSDGVLKLNFGKRDPTPRGKRITIE